VNLYVVGLNQLTDIKIDQVNKPHLPLASGAFTPAEAWVYVTISGLLALVIGIGFGPSLAYTFMLIMLIATFYSVAPIRLKKRPLMAAISIALARGVIANYGLYSHYRLTLGIDALVLPLLVAWLLLFFFGFGLVIALYKDIPDWAGDREFAIRTFAVRLGRQRVFDLGRWLLTAIYLIPIVVGLAFSTAPTGIVLALPHLVMLLLFWFFSLRTDPAQPASMTRLYLILWGLFYVEYLLLILYSAFPA
jgi:homogentisate phytyltransferase/homogentisate geranylgeranyltransferase